MSYSSPGDIDPEARRLIRHKATRLARCGFEREDVEQELALHAILKASLYDPARGTRSAFYESVLRHKAGSIMRAAMAAKRDRRRIAPRIDLNERCADDDIVMERLEREDALRVALDELPHRTRAVAGHLMHQGQSQAAASMGLSRQEVRTECKRIARRLREVGLGTKIPLDQPTAKAAA